MPTIPQSPRVVKPAPILLSMEAVRAGRASWRWTKPIDEAAAVQLGDAMWLSQAPRPHRDALAAARDEALGPVNGPCCQPELSPCISCSPPDLYPDEPFIPTAEDEAARLEWVREYNDRRWVERIEAGPTFLEEIAEVINLLGDSSNDRISWIGKVHVGKLYEEVSFLGATSLEDYLDKREAALDAARDAAEARAAMLAR